MRASLVPAWSGLCSWTAGGVAGLRRQAGRAHGNGGREASLWTDGVLARYRASSTTRCSPRAVRGRGRGFLCATCPTSCCRRTRRLTREESRRLLATFAAMHRRFAGERIDGACSLEDRVMIAAPATVVGEVDGVDYLPKILAVGWEVFAEEVPEDVATAVFGAVEDPKPLARELACCAATLIHNDLRGANLGLLSDRTIVLDWGMAGTGPCELDFAWYLFVNGWRIDATREQLVDDFRHVAADLHDARALELAWLAQLCWHGPLLSHELVEASDEKRERARAELAWWVERVRGALELL